MQNGFAILLQARHWLKGEAVLCQETSNWPSAYDSDVEEEFARDCENDDQVEFFIKLPEWFVIRTPIGTYNPDWALIFKNDKRLYFVAETKSVSEGATENLRRNELLKIKCGKAHFAEFEKVEYRQVQRLRELLA